MQLRHLRYFVKIVEAGSFSRAAATIFVAQPALSQQIAELEEQMGVSLLKRSARGVRPTAAGGGGGCVVFRGGVGNPAAGRAAAEHCAFQWRRGTRCGKPWDVLDARCNARRSIYRDLQVGSAENHPEVCCERQRIDQIEDTVPSV